MLGTHQLFFDVRKIAVMHIDIAVVYVKPCATVENTATPCADLGDLTLPTDLTQMLGLEIAAVVDRQIPVAIWTMCSPTRASTAAMSAVRCAARRSGEKGSADARLRRAGDAPSHAVVSPSVRAKMSAGSTSPADNPASAIAATLVA
ncbi:Uncharacterised protein [Mycobacteroides abscessus subsp. abscessus]|nr:Uncharacterised protein [Mycobacteroides abscessus subsp. abscessus]